MSAKSLQYAERVFARYHAKDETGQQHTLSPNQCRALVGLMVAVVEGETSVRISLRKLGHRIGIFDAHRIKDAVDSLIALGVISVGVRKPKVTTTYHLPNGYADDASNMDWLKTIRALNTDQSTRDMKQTARVRLNGRTKPSENPAPLPASAPPERQNMHRTEAETARINGHDPDAWRHEAGDEYAELQRLNVVQFGAKK